MEQIVPGSIIAINGGEPINAVVCTIRPRRAEVVYLDAAGRALHQEIEWRRGTWELLADARQGRPADKDPRLERYVKVLRTLQP